MILCSAFAYIYVVKIRAYILSVITIITAIMLCVEYSGNQSSSVTLQYTQFDKGVVDQHLDFIVESLVELGVTDVELEKKDSTGNYSLIYPEYQKEQVIALLYRIHSADQELFHVQFKEGYSSPYSMDLHHAPVVKLKSEVLRFSTSVTGGLWLSGYSPIDVVKQQIQIKNTFLSVIDKSPIHLQVLSTRAGPLLA